MQRVGVERFLKDGLKSSIIDVRSPAEFEKGHIPGTINIPIFTNLERARVGTAYKQQNRDEAITLGLEIVGPKMKSFVESARKIALDGKLNVYCWRGGMRSEKMAWLFELVGVETRVMEGGYKAYRKYMHDYFRQINNLIVIQGPTGSGKTKILYALKEAGEQVIDLEYLANHKGSAFGGLGENEQPTTQQFQNNIFAAIEDFNLAEPVWIESESATIGKVYLPESLWQQMNLATVLAIDVPREQRIKNIVEQYGGFCMDLLSEKITRLKQRLGGANVKLAINLLEEGKLTEAVDILLDYYDHSYSHSAAIYKTNKPISVLFASSDAKINADILINQLFEMSK